MSYPSGYDASGLAPRIEILDKNLNELYRWEHPQIASSPRQDFILESFFLETGINSDAGSAKITIEDDNNEIDSESLVNKFLRIKLGKTSAGMQNWFTGTISRPSYKRTSHRQKSIPLDALGISNLLAYTYVTINHSGDTNVSSLIQRVLTDSTIETIPSGIPSLTTSIETVPITVSHFQHNNQTKKSLIEKLASMGACHYGIDPDFRFFVRPRDSYSDYFVTNNPNPRYTADKISVIRNKSYAWEESVMQGGLTDIVYPDVTVIREQPGSRDISNVRLVGNSIAYIDLPDMPEIFETLQIYFRFTGANPDAAYMRIYKKSTPFSYTGVVTTSGLSFVTLAPRGFMSDIEQPNVAGWKNIDLTGDFWTAWGNLYESGKYYMLYFWGFGGSFSHQFNNLYLYHAGGSGGGYNTSYPYGQAGTLGKVALVVSSKDKAWLHATNTTARHAGYQKTKLKQGRDLSSPELELLATATLDTIGKTRRSYTPIKVSAPTTRPELGRRIHVQDTHTGINNYPFLLGYSVRGDQKNRLAPVDIDLHLGEFV